MVLVSVVGGHGWVWGSGPTSLYMKGRDKKYGILFLILDFLALKSNYQSPESAHGSKEDHQSNKNSLYPCRIKFTQWK